MKKNLFIVLAVLLLSCLFVSCSSCPEEVATGSITFKGEPTGVYYFLLEEETKSAIRCSEVFPLYKDESCEEESDYSICFLAVGTDHYGVGVYEGGTTGDLIFDTLEGESFGDNCEVNNNNPDEVYLNILKPHTVEFTHYKDDAPLTNVEVEFYKAASIYVEYGVN